MSEIYDLLKFGKPLISSLDDCSCIAWYCIQKFPWIGNPWMKFLTNPKIFVKGDIYNLWLHGKFRKDKLVIIVCKI